jgi:hypothetical protein
MLKVLPIVSTPHIAQERLTALAVTDLFAFPARAERFKPALRLEMPFD